MPVALDELRHVMGKKRAFIVTDPFLFKNGFTSAIEAKLDELGIATRLLLRRRARPVAAVRKEAPRPDALSSSRTCIIAIGGGSAMDAGKIMWVMYEHPECDFQDMAMDFMDIRKRVYTFPKMGEKAYFVAIPTSSGTGSEVHAVRHHHRRGDRHQVAAGRLRAAAQHGDRRRRQHDDPAEGPDLRLRHRRR